MAIQGNQAVLYVYEIIDGKQKVTQTKFSKNGTEVQKDMPEDKKVEPVPEEKKSEEQSA
jgi:hypothetical protein